jgi:hypothetical protein
MKNYNNSRQRKFIEQRAIKEAEFIISTGSTVRETAKHFGEVTWFIVHRDMTKILPEVNSTLAQEVYKIFRINQPRKELAS